MPQGGGERTSKNSVKTLTFWMPSPVDSYDIYIHIHISPTPYHLLPPLVVPEAQGNDFLSPHFLGSELVVDEAATATVQSQ